MAAWTPENTGPLPDSNGIDKLSSTLFAICQRKRLKRIGLQIHIQFTLIPLLRVLDNAIFQVAGQMNPRVLFGTFSNPVT